MKIVNLKEKYCKSLLPIGQTPNTSKSKNSRNLINKLITDYCNKIKPWEARLKNTQKTNQKYKKNTIIIKLKTLSWKSKSKNWRLSYQLKIDTKKSTVTYWQNINHNQDNCKGFYKKIGKFWNLRIIWPLRI